MVNTQVYVLLSQSRHRADYWWALLPKRDSAPSKHWKTKELSTKTFQNSFYETPLTNVTCLPYMMLHSMIQLFTDGKLYPTFVVSHSTRSSIVLHLLHCLRGGKLQWTWKLNTMQRKCIRARQHVFVSVAPWKATQILCYVENVFIVTYLLVSVFLFKVVLFLINDL